jgi:CRP-like cAMP-binding protein
MSADYLLHLANIMLLVGYSVRSILLLRCFAVAASLIGIPYYLLQTNILWPPVGWSVVFIAINTTQICRLLWERRPVVLSREEQMLYDLGFSTLTPRDFASLVTVGEWRTAMPGDKLLIEGQRTESIFVAISGAVDVHRKGHRIGQLLPGQTVGVALALLDEPSPIDATFIEPAQYMCWPLSHIRTFLNKKPQLRATLQQLTSHELARRVHQLVDKAS